jgi:transposase
LDDHDLGQTPVLQYHFNWKMLSAMAGVTWWNFYFRLFPDTIRSPQVIEFLAHLLRHLPGKLLIVWDGLRSHRSHLVWDFVRQQRGRLWPEFLPAYAPELNPVEYLWARWKQHELPNLLPRTELSRSSGAGPDAPPTHAGLRLLETSRAVSGVTNALHAARAKVVYCLHITVGPSMAQQPRVPNTELQRSAMKKLSFVVGKWSREARILRGSGEPLELVQTEEALYKLDGLVLMIEGIERNKTDGKVALQPLGVVSYDDETGTYHMRAYNDGCYLETS